MDKQTKLLEAGKCCEKATNEKPCCDDCVAESMGYASQYEEQSNKSAEEVLRGQIVKSGYSEGWTGKPAACIYNAMEEYAQSRITQLEKQNSELLSLLKSVKRVFINNDVSNVAPYTDIKNVVDRVKQALNSKEVGNG